MQNTFENWQEGFYSNTKVAFEPLPSLGYGSEWVADKGYFTTLRMRGYLLRLSVVTWQAWEAVENFDERIEFAK